MGKIEEQPVGIVQEPFSARYEERFHVGTPGFDARFATFTQDILSGKNTALVLRGGSGYGKTWLAQRGYAEVPRAGIAAVHFSVVIPGQSEGYIGDTWESSLKQQSPYISLDYLSRQEEGNAAAQVLSNYITDIPSFSPSNPAAPFLIDTDRITPEEAANQLCVALNTIQGKLPLAVIFDNFYKGDAPLDLFQETVIASLQQREGTGVIVTHDYRPLSRALTAALHDESSYDPDDEPAWSKDIFRQQLQVRNWYRDETHFEAVWMLCRGNPLLMTAGGQKEHPIDALSEIARARLAALPNHLQAAVTALSVYDFGWDQHIVRQLKESGQIPPSPDQSIMTGLEQSGLIQYHDGTMLYDLDYATGHAVAMHLLRTDPGAWKKCLEQAIAIISPRCGQGNPGDVASPEQMVAHYRRLLDNPPQV